MQKEREKKRKKKGVGVKGEHTLDVTWVTRETTSFVACVTSGVSILF